MKDLRVEQWLNQEGVGWHYELNIPLTKIDREASLKNQARFQAISQDHIIDLGIAVEKGSELPAMVGYYGKDRRIVLIDGNHRMEAYSLVGKAVSDFYIVDSAYGWVIERLTMTANMKEGWPPTREERLTHTLRLVRSQNMPVESAAKSLGLPPSTVQNALQAAETQERLNSLGFHEKLYPSVLENLNRVKQDTALLGCAKLVLGAQLTGEETAELARKVSRARSEAAQGAVIADMRHQFRSRIARTRSGQTKRLILPTIKLRKAVDAINSIRPESVRPLDKDLFRKTGYAVSKLEEIRQGEPQSE